ncbi:TPA: YchE family NAAT transporter [Pasteurella multocida]|uniref:YchE family NAAT transporter n=1 Tax=Pasteurella multocida TaxID=747 RepID=UPI0028DF6533|nr:YchE family NAAT transporter [Pasteurella multocida]HDR1410078.1 YchE family NAAT transporter [Pasteurella multocida]HDR1605985.1 YchE family NAAT transporter [Pasteurella multocida]HDR1827447.1 YchE family NAAT transporter [Pasteurella multocida]HDR1867459.1 YchE family NAAT transporter [Pasteurella multocida]
MDFAIYLQFFIGLIALVNPIGVVPIFYSMTSTLSKEQQNRTSFITCISISVILLVSFFFGSFILNAFHISIDSFRIAGGIVVILIALTMINGKIGEHKMNKEEKSENFDDYNNIAVVPLATPIMAGPGSISATIVFSSTQNSLINYFYSSITIILFGIGCYILLRYSKPVIKRLGKTGSNVITRIMGLLLMSLGIEIIIGGLRNLGIV